MEDKLNVISKAIGNSVVFLRPEVVSMLNENKITENAEKMDSEQLINSVIVGIKGSEKFRNEYDVLISSNQDFLVDSYLGISGETWLTSGTSLLGGALTFFGTQKTSDAIKAQSNAQASISQSQLEIAKINQQTELAKLEALKQGGGLPQKSNTGLYVGLGLGGLLILGLVVYVAVKK
jgi:hypothetical protein